MYTNTTTKQLKQTIKEVLNINGVDSTNTNQMLNCVIRYRNKIISISLTNITYKRLALLMTHSLSLLSSTFSLDNKAI